MQPVSASQFKAISGTAAGTANLFARSGNLIRVIIPANLTGTVTFYDSGTATDVADPIVSLPCTVGTIPTSIEIGCAVSHGLTYAVGGTTGLTVIFD